MNEFLAFAAAMVVCGILFEIVIRKLSSQSCRTLVTRPRATERARADRRH